MNQNKIAGIERYVFCEIFAFGAELKISHISVSGFVSEGGDPSKCGIAFR
jgi:hypothetical protein